MLSFPSANDTISSDFALYELRTRNSNKCISVASRMAIIKTYNYSLSMLSEWENEVNDSLI